MLVCVRVATDRAPSQSSGPTDVPGIPARLPDPPATAPGPALRPRLQRQGLTSRHDNTFYLFEALVKLAAAPAVASYLHEIEQGGPRVAELDRVLVHLALPSLGQWVGMLRELARHFGTRPDAASHPLGHLWDQLNRPHRDRPALLALYRRIKNGPDGAAGRRPELLAACRCSTPWCSTATASSATAAPRFESFYDRGDGAAARSRPPTSCWPRGCSTCSARAAAAWST